jgi:hypothetical protein
MTMGTQIPVIVEKPLAACGCRKFQLDAMGDHLCTCTTHSGAKKDHDWVIEQLADLFRTTHKVKTQHVAKSRGRHCGDIELATYFVNTTDPVPLVPDLRIAHDRFGTSFDPRLNGHLHYPNDIDKSLNEAAADKIRKYRADHINNPPITVSFMPASTSGRLHREFIRLLFLQTRLIVGKTDSSFATSGVQFAQSTSGLFHFRRVSFPSHLKSKVGSTLSKAAALRINLNIDGEPITSRTHTHPSHSQTSLLLTSSLSLGVPVPRATQGMRDV